MTGTRGASCVKSNQVHGWPYSYGQPGVEASRCHFMYLSLKLTQLLMANHWKSYSLVEHGVHLKNLACII